MVRSRMLLFTGISLALLLVAAPLSAQDRGGRGGQGRQGRSFGGRGGFGMDKLGLLRIAQVREELKVTEEQQEKVSAVQAALREETRGLSMRGLRDLPEEERDKKIAEIRAKRAELTKGAEKKLAGILDKKQGKRLGQIALQMGGVQALKGKNVVAKLKLSEEQVGKIDAAIQSGRDEQTKLFEEMRNAGGDRREAFAKMQEARQKITKDVMAKAMAALDDAQKEKYTKMKGEKFELDREALRQGRGGFQRGGREGRPGGEGGEGGRRRGRPEEEV